jgi:integrase
MASIEDKRWTRKDGQKIPSGYTGNRPWKVRWQYNGQDKARSFARKADAEAFKRDVEGLRDAWIDPKKTGVLFSDLADTWWATTVKLRHNTRRGYYTKLHNHVLPYFGDMPQNTIEWLTVEQFIAAKVGDGHNPKQVRNMVSLVSLVMNIAVKGRLRQDNPAADHEYHIRQRKLDHSDVLSMEQAQRLVDHVRDPYKPLMWLLILTGMRPAEVCGLRIRDLNLGRRLLHVCRDLNYVHAYADVPVGVHEEPTKTESSDRFIPLDELLCSELGTMLKARADALGRPLHRDEPLFESIKGGKPLKVPDLRRWIMVPALKAAGLPTTFRTYDTRHTHATILIDEGHNLAEVGERLGHNDHGLTAQRVYYHLYEGRQREISDHMGELRKEAKEAREAPTETTQDNVVNLFGGSRQVRKGPIS